MDESAVAAKLDEVWRYHLAGDPRARLAEWRQREPDQEYRFSISSASSQFLLIEVCGRYGLEVYRRTRTRQTTICVDAPTGFINEVLWPVYEQMAHVLQEAMLQASQRIIEQWVSATEQVKK